MILDNDIERVLFTYQEIDKRCKEIAADITRDYQDKAPVFIGVLRGAAAFMLNLLKYINLYCTTDFLVCSSYQGKAYSSGVVHLKKDIDVDISGKDVILVEDIVDSGKTMHLVKEMLLSRGASSVKIASLLDKKSGRTVPIDVDYYCFDVENQFVVGFGLDYEEYYRNLPYVGILKKEIYEKKF